MCRYFQYTRAAYYKSLQSDERVVFSDAMILDLIHRERRLQPRLGGRKLYWLLREDIHQISPHIGRDKFFSLLRKHDLLVERKRQYRKTTHSWHHFHKYGNLIKDVLIFRPNQA
jgi:hypothetical protein